MPWACVFVLTVSAHSWPCIPEEATHDCLRMRWICGVAKKENQKRIRDTSSNNGTSEKYDYIEKADVAETCQVKEKSTNAPRTLF